MKNASSALRAPSKATLIENELLLREAEKLAHALGKMFAPCCEVVLNDFTTPEPVIRRIECALSGRQVGEPSTEMGWARIHDPNFPDVVQNYANRFPDGRPAKSTSIGLRNSAGTCIGSICLNLDVSLFSSVQRVLEQFTSSNPSETSVQETLRPRSGNEIRQVVEQFAAAHNTQPHTLSARHRNEIIQQLADAGMLEFRSAIPTVAEVLGVSRALVYYVLKKEASS